MVSQLLFQFQKWLENCKFLVGAEGTAMGTQPGLSCIARRSCVRAAPVTSPLMALGTSLKVPKRGEIRFRLTRKLPGCIAPHYLLF